MDPSGARIPGIGDVLGRYRILELVGRGGMGPVYRAWDENLAREVALKTLWPQHAVDEDVRKRFEREARSAARLDSPCVVRVYDFGELNGLPYIAMEFVRGGAVASDQGVTRPMEWRRAVEIGRDVAEALALAHGQGMLHRDVKPANVMIGSEGRAKLVDFGLARAITDESIAVTQMGTILGTPAYMAPEVIEGRDASALSDIYSLGVLIYRLTAGRLPFEASSAAAAIRGHLEGRLTPLRHVVPGVPADLDAVISGCTDRDPLRRYPDCACVKDDLERCLSGQPITGPPEPDDEIRIDLPIWVRLIPGAERTLVGIHRDARTADRKARETERLLHDAEEIVRGLAVRRAEAERNASGWRLVAENALEEGREDDAREALGYARQYDDIAGSYASERNEQERAAVELRTRVTEARAAAEEAVIRGRILINRRDRALLILGDAIQKPRRLITLAVVALLALVTAFAAAKSGWWAVPLSSDPSPHPVDPPSTVPSSPPAGAEFAAVGNVEAESNRGILPTLVVYRGDPSGWDEGDVNFPFIWRQGDRYLMAYRGGGRRLPPKIGFAESRDGTTWTPSSHVPIPAPAGYDAITCPVYIAELGILLAQVASGGTVRGVHAWREIDAGRFDPVGLVIRCSDVGPGVGTIDPRSILEDNGRYRMFAHVGDRQRKPAVYILSAASTDGLAWGDFRVELDPSTSGADRGAVSCPMVYREHDGNRLALFYTATESLFGSPVNNIFRATAGSGEPFGDRSLFLEPRRVGPEYIHVTAPFLAEIDHRRFLYFTAYDAGMKTSILMLKIPNPEFAAVQ